MIERFPNSKRLQVNPQMEMAPDKMTYVARIEEAPPGKGENLSEQSWLIQIQADRYLPFVLGPLRLKVVDHRVTVADSRDRLEATLVRDPSRWRADFSCSRDLFLEDAFQSLGEVLRRSGKVYLHKGGLFAKWENLGSLSEAGFSNPDGKVGDELDRARATLLNLYHVLKPQGGASCSTDELTDWFQYVREIHVIDQERMIALVSSDMFDRVREQAIAHPAFACSANFSASTLLHPMKDPRSGYWDHNKMPTPREKISIKTPLCQGNVQITVARFEDGTRTPEVLADFDIDEHLALLLHSSDVVKHTLSGRGTSAYEMTELLGARYRALQRPGNRPAAEPRLGYTLVPANQLRTPSCPTTRTPRLGLSP